MFLLYFLLIWISLVSPWVVLCMSTPMGNSVIMDRVYPLCVVTFYGYETRADLLLVDMVVFEVILGTN